MFKTDVLVIGAGAVGCAIARELTKYQVKVTVVEKNEDVGGDASKSNSAIIHTVIHSSNTAGLMLVSSQTRAGFIRFPPLAQGMF